MNARENPAPPRVLTCESRPRGTATELRCEPCGASSGEAARPGTALAWAAAHLAATGHEDYVRGDRAHLRITARER